MAHDVDWGARRPVNYRAREGERIASVVLTKPGYHGAWFGRCETCGGEALYSKSRIRRGSVRCETCKEQNHG